MKCSVEERLRRRRKTVCSLFLAGYLVLLLWLAGRTVGVVSGGSVSWTLWLICALGAAISLFGLLLRRQFHSHVPGWFILFIVFSPSLAFLRLSNAFEFLNLPMMDLVLLFAAILALAAPIYVIVGVRTEVDRELEEKERAALGQTARMNWDSTGK